MKTMNQQSGVAVITAVLILALATTAAVAIAAEYQLNMRRSDNAFSSSQAWAYAKGAEQWTMAILARDQEDNTYDGFDEPWWNNNQSTTFPLPNGYIEGKIEDAQGKLNVNSLMDGNAINPVMRRRIEQLFVVLEIEPSLVEAIIDWIDGDRTFAGPNGAEYDIYQGLEDPYLPADQPMNDISELRMIHGFSQEIYDKVSPHLTALPSNIVLNLNTASAEVLASLDPNLTIQVSKEMVDERIEDPYQQLNDFIKHAQEHGVTVNETQGITTQSSYFDLHTKAVIGKSQVKMVSTIYRGAGNNLKVLKRSQKL